MARKPRQEVAGGLFHVFARGNDRRDIFLDSTDRRCYLTMLAREVRRQHWLLLGYCLMPNHVHLLVETPDPNLGAGMQRLHAPYAQAFNKRHGRVGHVFQGRYGAVQVKTDAYFATVVRYVAVNPVAAAFVEIPCDWPWSSHRALIGREDPPPWLAVQRLRELLGELEGRESYEALTRT